MKNYYLSALFFFIGLSELFAQSPRMFTSTELGIKMAPPRIDPTFDQVYTICSFYFPVSNGFSANVNVQYQPYSDSIIEYDKLSSGQFEQLKFKVLSRSLLIDSVAYEYSGFLQERYLHWYSVAKKVNGGVYLITATALESDWERLSNSLRSSVDSFQIISNLGFDPNNYSEYPKESDFWKILSEIDKIIFARGLLEGVMSEKTMSYLILQELDKLSATMTVDQQKIRRELIDQYRAVNKDISDRLSQAYNSHWQQECVKFIDNFYEDSKNHDKPLSIVFFYYLNMKFNWGYSVY